MERVLAAAKEGFEDGLSGLERLKRNLQNAAVLCQPAGAAGAVFETELEASFDSADLDEEDPDEGVGVDERAALLQPEDFFLDDEDWYASARWLMERPQTEDFITAALLTHMAPLYVPFADIRARTPKEVVPADVQRDMRSFAVDFVAETNLRSLSVKDVKEGIGEGLGSVGFSFIPQEVAPYDHPVVDALLHAGGEPLGFFSEKFDDTDESWSVWHCLLTGTYEESEDDADDEEDEEEDEDEDGMEEEGSAPEAVGGRGDAEAGAEAAGHGQTGSEKMAARDSACQADDDDESKALGGREEAQGEGRQAEEQGALVQRGEQALREMVLQVVRKSCPDYYSSAKVELGREAAGALGAFIARLQQGKNARNALMLLRRIACHPLPPPPRPRPLCVAAIWQAYLKILMAGPLRGIRLESEDLPPAAVKAAYDCAASTVQASVAWEAAGEVGRLHSEEKLLLDHLAADNQALGGIAGWCLKFLFEGLDSLHDLARRRSAFVQFALEAKHGPLMGVVVAGENEWSWDEARVPCDEALTTFAEAYGENFALAHGDTLGSILDEYLLALSEAGFKDGSGSWSCDVWRPNVAASPVKKRQVASEVDASQGCRPPASGDTPAFGQLPVPAFGALPELPPAVVPAPGALAVASPLSAEKGAQCGGAAASKDASSSVHELDAALQAAQLSGRDEVSGEDVRANAQTEALPPKQHKQPRATCAQDAVW